MTKLFKSYSVLVLCTVFMYVCTLYVKWRRSVFIDIKCNRCNVNITLWHTVCLTTNYKALIIHSVKYVVCRLAYTAPLIYCVSSINKHIWTIPLLDVLHFFHDPISWNVYIFGNLSIVIYMILFQQSHHSTVHVNLEIMPRANSICGHEWYCVAL